MAHRGLKWCFGLKGGLRMREPNERLATAYMEQAKSSLLRAERDLRDGDLLWATVAIYYAEYYALYALLQRIGVKCENHFCSILAVSALLGEERTKIINAHKDKRIDAQYYIKVEREEAVASMLQEAKQFVAGFDEVVSGLRQEDIEKYRKSLLPSSK